MIDDIINMDNQPNTAKYWEVKTLQSYQFYSSVRIVGKKLDNKAKQAGADLCQAQSQLG